MTVVRKNSAATMAHRQVHLCCRFRVIQGSHSSSAVTSDEQSATEYVALYMQYHCHVLTPQPVATNRTGTAPGAKL